MTFSIMFWNVWYDNQVNGDTRLEQLLNELQRLVDQHQPDFITMCELVQPAQAPLPPVVKRLQDLGYTYSEYTDMEELPGYWCSGVAFCSRLKISDKQTFAISKNAYAANHGHPGLIKEVLGVKVALPKGRDLNVIVAHPVAIADSFKEHQAGMKSLEKLVRSDDYRQNTILLGDINEWRFIPDSFRSRVADIMHARTGSFLKPTWRYNANHFTPLRLNLDYVYWSKTSDFRLIDFVLLSSDASDHQPLLATFAY